MYNLLLKELKLGVNPFFYLLPFLTGALMLIPGWLYFIVLLYFCWITVPNICGAYKSQNDLEFSLMMPVTKNDIVKAKVAVIVILELLHIVTAVFFGIISTHLYPNIQNFFFGPTVGFWGLGFIMLAIFNLIFISMYFKTAYKFGAPTIAAITGAMLFAGGAEWLGIKNSMMFDLFKGSGSDNLAIHVPILLAGMAIFAGFTIIAYYIAIKRFKKVDI
ncbi:MULTISPECIES: ABC-2 transporter permease [Pontibacillus]|uniref:ABC-2 transporter permease n=1 Tax=Pontibacillus chungwhensis TaxID=265426 RepID=A0ABY8V0J3_9BACI|nr:MULTISPECIES: ABC-2 transporter permease [Pontibacillus]MCD5324551.1 ABC-2 transporter permease [Pontibacillus sp. HN14]WIF99153.1 ABC-2 transporter permease [Pontibacillus chungwhensis]